MDPNSVPAEEFEAMVLEALDSLLIAQRAKDTGDVVPLAKRLKMHDASAKDLESHIRRYYTDEAALEFIVDGDDVDREIRYLAEDAARMLKRRAASG